MRNMKYIDEGVEATAASRQVIIEYLKILAGDSL